MNCTQKKCSPEIFNTARLVMVSIILTTFFGSNVSAQNSEKFPIGQVSVNAVTEKEKSIYQETNASEENQMVSKIMLLDSEIRATIQNQNLGTEILNQYFQKLNSVCVECLTENILNERATFVFASNDAAAAQNLLDFLEEYHTNLQY